MKKRYAIIGLGSNDSFAGEKELAHFSMLGYGDLTERPDSPFMFGSFTPDYGMYAYFAHAYAVEVI